MELNYSILYLIIYFNLCINLSRTENVDLKLSLVQVLFRHGERTPIQLELNRFNYTDPSLYEPYGLGKLTNNGKMEEYKIGVMLRQEYDGFLSSKYESTDVYAQPSEQDRTIESLLLVLAGLYPPTPDLIWNPHLLWMPIAFHSPLPEEVDILFKPFFSTKFQKLFKEATHSREYDEKISKFSTFIDFLNNKTGFTIDPYNIVDILGLYGNFHINERMKLPLPSWYTKEVKEEFDELAGFAMDSISMTRHLIRLVAGPVVKEFLNNMNIHGLYDNPRKIYLFSGHDINVASFLKAHKISSISYPDFGSAVILEKWKDDQNNLFIRLLFWDSNSEKLEALRIADCKEYCPMNEYLKIIKDVYPSNEEATYLLDDFYRSNKTYEDLLFVDDVVKKK